MSDPVGHMGTEVSFADLEAPPEAAKAPDLSTIKLEGDDVPEMFRGKTVKETISALSTTLESFKGSERARVELQARVDALSRPNVVREERAAPAQEPLTKEKLDALYKEDPTAATAMIVARAMESINANIEARIGPIKAASASTVESQVRQEFAAEFEDFGPEIKAIVDNIPDKSTLGNPESWKQIISYVRGRPENFEKLVTRHNSKKGEPASALTLDAVRRAAGDTAPANNTGTRSGSSGGKGGAAPELKWSQEEDKVRQTLGYSVAEWEKYR